MYKKYFNIFLIILIFSSQANSSENVIKNLKEGGKIIFIRHALAPGGGDPDNFNLNDCKTQRNLSKEGINQSKKIGSFFYKNKIPIDRVLSSEWCRCKDTAKYAFKKYKTFDALNSFFSKKFQKNKKKQMKDLLNFIKKWNGKGNLILVTHYVVIFETLNLPVSSGDLVITSKNLNLLGIVDNY